MIFFTIFHYAKLNKLSLELKIQIARDFPYCAFQETLNDHLHKVNFVEMFQIQKINQVLYNQHYSYN